MKELVLVINAGSSSIKFQLFEAHEHDPIMLYKGLIDGIYVDPKFVAKDANDNKLTDERLPADLPKSHDSALRHLLAWMQPHLHGRKIAAIGHRVLHGGMKYSEPVLITPEVFAVLEEFIPLGPLHQPHNLTPIRILNELMPGVPQVACFDTAFHMAQPPMHKLYALPLEFSEKEHIYRYGFHGLSYTYIASAMPELDKKAAEGHTVVCHLGNGSSAAAVKGGKCQATTMGFTALEGLPMGTRTGSIDAGVVLHCLNHLKMDAKQIEELLYKKSGLLGLSGISSDMRELHASTDPRAKLAVDFFTYRISREVASLATAMQGFDALVFTAGIGENDDLVRADVCARLSWLGVEIDLEANAKRSGEPRKISTANSKVSVWVVPTNEELMIARAAVKCAA
jgi:acetate kinase